MLFVSMVEYATLVLNATAVKYVNITAFDRRANLVAAEEYAIMEKFGVYASSAKVEAYARI